MPVLVATLGFDIEHVIHAFRLERFDRIVLLTAMNPDKRTENALDSLRKALGFIRVEDSRVPVYDVSRAVWDIRDQLKRILAEHFGDVIVLSLSGGMRILVLEAFLAYLLLDRSDRRRIKVINIVEGTNDFVEIKVEELETHPQLSEVEKRVLEVIKREKIVTVERIRRELGLSTSTVYKALQKLIEKNLVVRVDRGSYMLSYSTLYVA